MNLHSRHSCECKLGYAGSGQWGDCRDVCENRCRNEVRKRKIQNTAFLSSNFILVQGTCLKDKLGNAYCQCVGSFTGDDCETKSEFAYIAGGEKMKRKTVQLSTVFLIDDIPGIAGAIIFLILLVLLVWMICVRATRPKKPEKVINKSL